MDQFLQIHRQTPRLWPGWWRRVAGRVASPTLIVLVTSFCVATCGVAAEWQPEKLAEMLRPIEERVAGLRWNFRYSRAKPSNAKALAIDELGLQDIPDNHHTGRALVDVRRDFYLLEIESVTPWKGGAAPHISTHEAGSYDGKTYRFWEQSAHGTTLPKLEEITKFSVTGQVNALDASKPSWFDQRVQRVGLRCFPPFVTPVDSGGRRVTRLSEIVAARIKAGKKVTITEQSRDVIVVEMEHPETNGIVRFYLDSSRDLFPVRTEWANGSGPTVWQREIVDCELDGEGYWVPRRAAHVFTLENSGYQVAFTNVKINPSISEPDLRLRFPAGTNVQDHVENLFYIVGKGPEAEAKEVREFVQKIALAGPPKEPAHRLRTVLIVVVVVATAVVLVVGWWKFRGSNVWLIAACLGAFATGGSPTNAEAEVTMTDGVWTARYADEEVVTISQCGFHVAIFALEVFQRKYDPKLVSEALHPRMDGVALSDISHVLRAHGLTIQGRKQVLAADVSRGLKAGQIAIFPIPMPQGRSHYLVALRNAEGRVIIADVPRKVAEFADVFGNEDQQSRYLALFVSQPLNRAASKNMGEECSIDRADIDLGRIEPGRATSTGDIKSTIRIGNPSDEPVAVKLTKSCGCASLSWGGGILPARSGQTVTVSVLARTWNEGPHREMIWLGFPDGSSRQVAIRGEVVNFGAPKSAAAHKQVVFEILPTARGEGYSAMQRVRLDDAKPAEDDRFTCRSIADWLAADVRRESGSVFLDLKLDLSTEALVTLFSEGRRRETRVNVVYPGDVKVVAIDVTAIALPLVESSPSIARISRAGNLQAQVVLKLRDPSDGPVVVRRFWSVPKGLEFHVADAGQSSEASVILSCSQPIEPIEQTAMAQSFVAYFDLESRTNRHDVASVVVLIDE